MCIREESPNISPDSPFYKGYPSGYSRWKFRPDVWYSQDSSKWNSIKITVPISVQMRSSQGFSPVGRSDKMKDRLDAFHFGPSVGPSNTFILDWYLQFSWTKWQNESQTRCHLDFHFGLIPSSQLDHLHFHFGVIPSVKLEPVKTRWKSKSHRRSEDSMKVSLKFSRDLRLDDI